MTSRIPRLPFLLVLLLFAAACGGPDGPGRAVITVEEGPFQVVVPAVGELQAVTSTPVSVPPHVQGSLVISWLAAENTFVKKGDVVIRFADTWYAEKIREQEYALARLDLDITQKKKQLQKEEKNLKQQLNMARLEAEMFDTYSARDETIYARNKIIDDSIDLEYLKQKTRYLEQKRKKLAQKAAAELQLLELRKKTHQVRLDQYKSALDALVIKAPHDGLFVYEKNWRGKPRVGMDTYRGMKLGKLPDLSRMEAKVYVLESEAAGIDKDMAAEVILDSRPGTVYRGTVKSVDNIAKTLERDNPQKYFEIVLSLDHTDTAFMKPGSQLKAKIFVQKIERAISVPNQALFLEDGKTFVHVVKGTRLEKRGVTVGARSLTRTVIDAGLKPGEKVSLGIPGQTGGGE